VKILLDECMDTKIVRLFQVHEVKTVKDMDWLGIQNGELLNLAASHFDVFLTVDRHMPDQQNISKLALIVVVVRGTNLRARRMAPLIPKIESAIGLASPGEVVIVS